VVDDEQRLVGIVTNRDLIERGGLSARVELLGALAGAALERELAASGVRERTAADVMTREVVAVLASERLDRVAHQMVERAIKRMPVVDERGHLLGMVSRADLLRTMGQDYPAPPPGPTVLPARIRRVSDVMRDDVPVVGMDAPLGEVLDAITATRLNRAVIVDGERRVLGVVSDADLLAALDPGGQTGLLGALMGRAGFESPGRGSSARDLVGHDRPLTVGVDTPAAEARLKVLPVTDAEGRLLGTADRADLLRALS
jgi:CBS domain-containing protein